jgi:hypothetical protein
MQARSEAIQELTASGLLRGPSQLPELGALEGSAADEVEADLRELVAEIVRASL